MKSIILLLFIPLSITAQFDWKQSNVGNGIKPDIAYHQGRIFIAYMNEANQGYVKCAEIEDGVLNAESTVSNGYFYGPLDIAVDNNGSPRILYHDHSAEDLIHATKSSGVWNLDQITSSGHDGWDGSIFIDNQNISHLISIDPSGGAEYATPSGSTWTVETINASSGTYKFATDIVKFNDIIHVVYYLSGTNDLYYSHKESGSWQNEVIAKNGIYPSLVIDENGNPTVAYYLNGSEKSIQLAQKENNTWVSTKVEDLSGIDVNFSGGRKVVDLEYVRGKYHIAYNNKKIVRYGTLQESGWVLENALNVNGSNVILGQQISLVIDEKEIPHMTYFERTNGVVGGGIIQYIYGEFKDSMMMDTMMMDTMMMDTMMMDTMMMSGTTIGLSSKTSMGADIGAVNYIIKGEQNQILGSINETNTFILENLPEGATMLCPTKSEGPTENVSALDLVRSQRLILGISDHCKTDFMAADVNKSGEASALDILLTINLLLGKTTNFPNNESWRFYKSDIDIESMSLTEIYELGCIDITSIDANSNVNFTGVKLGDINCEK